MCPVLLLLMLMNLQKPAEQNNSVLFRCEMSRSHNNNSWWLHSNLKPDSFHPAVKAMCPWLWTALSPLEFSHLCTGTHWDFNPVNDSIGPGLRGFPGSEGLAAGAFSCVSRQLNIPSKLLISEKHAGLYSSLLKWSGWQKVGTWNLNKNPGQDVWILNSSIGGAAAVCDSALMTAVLLLWLARNRKNPHFCDTFFFTGFQKRFRSFWNISNNPRRFKVFPLEQCLFLECFTYLMFGNGNNNE